MFLPFFVCRIPVRIPLSALAAACCCLTPVAGLSAAIAGGGLDGNYTNKVISAVVKHWSPPPALKNNFMVRIKISIDQNGKVAACKAIVPSGLEAFDATACGAAKNAGSFGTPPYAQPLDVYMTFWSGSPLSKTPSKEVDSAAAMRAEVMARTRSEAVRNGHSASATEAQARQRAEAAANASGKDLPTIQPSPAAPPASAKQKRERAKRNSPHFATENGRSASATQPVRPPQQATAQTRNATAANQTRPAPASTSSPSQNNATTSALTETYRRVVAEKLRSAIVIPKATMPGNYTARLRLHISPKGVVERFTTLSSSGDVHLDKAIRSGIRRMGMLPPPPESVKGTLDISPTFSRR